MKTNMTYWRTLSQAIDCVEGTLCPFNNNVGLSMSK